MAEAKKKAPAKAVKTAAKTAVKKTAAKKAPAKKAAPTNAEIAQLAHKFWQERGGHHGSDREDWLRAERELKK